MIFKNCDFIYEHLEQGNYDGLKNYHQVATTRKVPAFITAPIMVSAHQIKHLNKIDELPCDAIIINLEDGVALKDKKKALHLAKLFIANSYYVEKTIIVRVNALEEGGIEEIKFLSDVKVDAIRVPKITTAQEVQCALDLIPLDTKVHLSIETKQAWQTIETLKIDDRVSTFYLGILDLLADLQLPQSIITPNNAMVHYILTHFLMQCKLLDVQAVSFVYQDYKNINEFQQWLIFEKSIGYKAKGVISPDQAKLAMNILQLSEKERKKAEEIVSLFETQANQGVTGFTHETYGFIDEPIYKGALALLH